MKIQTFPNFFSKSSSKNVNQSVFAKKIWTFLQWNHSEYSHVVYWSKFLLELSTWSTYETCISWCVKITIFFACFCTVFIIVSAVNWFCIFMGSSYVRAPYVYVWLLLCKDHLEHNDERLRLKSVTGARQVRSCTEFGSTPFHAECWLKKAKNKKSTF